MDIEDIAIASAEYKPDDRKKRIAAKAELWNYLNSIADDILKWEGSVEDLAEDISHQTMRILHPAFELKEIYFVLNSIFTTIRLEVPEKIHERFVYQASDMVYSKIKNYKPPENPSDHLK